MPSDHGVHLALHVYDCHQGREGLVRRYGRRTKHDWFMEPDHSMAQGTGSNLYPDTLPYRIHIQLLIPWRFFRLWALADGIDPPENMIRCVTNNYSTLGFWRSWHRSYNLWIVR